MRFDFDFYSSLLLIFFVHTAVYSVLFLIRCFRQNQISNFWIGIFLFLAALYIAPWMLGFAGWYAYQPYRDIMFYTPLQQLYLIGPCIFFYVQSLFNPQFKFNKKWLLHFVPAGIYLLLCIVVVVYDKLIVHQYFFLKNQQDPDFDEWYQITGFISMIIYFSASIRYYQLYKKAIREVISNEANFLFSWVRNFLVAFLSILVAWLVLAICNIFFQMPYSVRWWYFLSFAISCYYIAIAGYSNAVETTIFFKSEHVFKSSYEIFLLSKSKPSALETNQAIFQLVYSERSSSIINLSTENFEAWKMRIEKLILNEQLFLQPNLTLFEVAQKLNTNVSLLSKAINIGFRMNFNDLINKYRVTHLLELLRSGKHKSQTLLSIAYECGFNSKTTFNRAFKKNIGITPQEYIKRNLA